MPIVADNHQSVFSIIVKSISNHLGSFLIGLLVTVIFYFVIRYSFFLTIHSIFDEIKPFANRLFNIGLVAIAINSILIGGTVFIPKGHIGVLTVFGERKEGMKITEGYTWLGPNFILGHEMESIRAKDIYINEAKFSNDLVSVKYNVAYSFNVVDAIKHDNNFKTLGEQALKSSLEESIRDSSISLKYIESILRNGRELSEYLIAKSNEKVKNIWGIEIQTASVSQIETENPQLLNIYARAELEIRETLLDLYKKGAEFDFYISKIELILKGVNSQLNNSQILELLKHLINQIKFYRFDINMNEDMKGFFEDILNKTKEKFS